MTFGSSPRRGSRGCLLATLLLLAVLADACGAARTAVAAPPTVRLVGEVRMSGPGPGAFAADQRWLDALPAAALAMADTVLEASSPPALRRDAVRALVGIPAAATGDSAAAGRPVSALLRDRWLDRGYFSCTIARRETPDGIVFEVSPGEPYRLGTVLVEGEDFPGRDAALARALPRTGDVFSATAWAAGVDRLLAAAAEAGYPFCQWLVRDVGAYPGRADVDVVALLLLGPPSVFGPQSSDLPDGRGEDFLVRAARLPTGRRYRESDLSAARVRLLQRNIYADVGEPVVFTTAAPGTVGVHWPVTPISRPNRAAVMLGLSRTGEDEPARLSGQVDLRLANLAGTGRRMELAWSDDGRSRSHFGFGWLEPLLWGTPFDATVDVDHEVATDVYTRFRVDGRLQLPVAGAWQVEMGLGWDRSTFPTGAWNRTTRWRARGAFLHRRGDRGVNGWEGTFAIESARRGVDMRPDEDAVTDATPGEMRQTLVELRLGGERWLTPTLSVAINGLFLEVAGEGDATPLAEQYRLGGARTLRGYLEDQFHGERVASSMLELRIGRPGRSRLYTFFDVGYFRFAGEDPTRPDETATFEGTRRGFGLGLETATPGGDISLAVGFPGEFQFDDAKLHIALLQSF